MFNDDRKKIPLDEELHIIERVLAKVREMLGLTDKNFHLRLVLSGLKILGRPNICMHIVNVIEGRTYTNLISGFDMVNQENVTLPILSFVPDILDGKIRDTKNMPCFFHCGETHERDSTNVCDAILLDSKRLGHGFQIFLHPQLQKEAKDRDICIEACPISNLLLGYTTDLRNHPVRYLLHKGLQASISSDDPGFFGYDGVTMDYTMVYVAWELSIRDLKKFCLNGIKYSTIDDDQKEYLTNVLFPADWDKFIQHILTNYSDYK